MLKEAVIIEFFGPQRSIVGKDTITLPLTDRITAADALNYVKGKYPDITLSEGLFLIAVNHHIVPPETTLKTNDRVCFIPAIGGG